MFRQFVQARFTHFEKIRYGYVPGSIDLMGKHGSQGRKIGISHHLMPCTLDWEIP